MKIIQTYNVQRKPKYALQGGVIMYWAHINFQNRRNRTKYST